MASNHPVRIALAAGCATLWITALGCSGGNEEPTDAGTPAASAPTETGSRTVTLPGNTENPVFAEVAKGELPTGFPEDIPQPPKSEPANSMFIPGQGGMVTFRSRASRADVRDYYAEQLPSQGWEIDEPAEDAARVVINARKGDRTTSVIIASGGKGSEIMISIVEGG